MRKEKGKEKVEFNTELLKEAQSCATTEELIAKAKATNIELSTEEAAQILEKVTMQDLSEDDISMIAGGGCITGVTSCPDCGSEDIKKTKTETGSCTVTKYYHCNACLNDWWVQKDKPIHGNI